MPGRILVIRGGAIGDFILTLPAIGLLRENLPETRIDILGYPSIGALGIDPRYADTVHSIEYGPLAGFFSRRPNLDPAMSEFFAGYQQIISYLYDPDEVFSRNLQTVGVKNLLTGPGKLDDSAHATQQLAAPLQRLAFFLDNPLPHFTPRPADLAAAQPLLDRLPRPFIVIHPGSGSGRKNWPADRWRTVLDTCKRAGFHVLLVGGEAEEKLWPSFRDSGACEAFGLPLRTVGTLLTRCTAFFGHDSGISHLAAAAGAHCLLLFGPTDPQVWGPLHPGVEILTSPDFTLEGIPTEVVLEKIAPFLAA